MAVYVDDFLPGVREFGLNTLKATSLQSTSVTSLSSSGAITGASTSVSGTLTARNATATPAAASAVDALVFGTALIGLSWGTGAPTLTKPKGSLYIQTDGSSTSTRFYINTDGAATWTAITTAA